MLTSSRARIHFAPNEEATANLTKAKGRVVNTGNNTLSDSLQYAKTMPCDDQKIEDVISSEKYFVFVIHRQENLSKDDFVREVMKHISHASKKMKCVIILHKITEIKLKQLGLLEDLMADDHYITFPRVDYFDFMKLLQGAEFVITDGGSNQEELSYMGKPCFIMRKTTERYEGIGENAVLMGDKGLDSMERFIDDYKSYEKVVSDRIGSPSKIVIDELIK
ncbi:MAG: UDP-N-acetylglucosamine 2-epimerase [Lachnospiraceae bacterium]|nr:UDP-N-acetylglucosamine 2-epimerase [Lachnospiraceae bacterium]